MSLDVTLYMDIDTGGKELHRVELYWGNITHNLNKMAEQVKVHDTDLYTLLWRPEELEYDRGYYLVDGLAKGLKELKDHPEKYKKYDSQNGWGVYDDFVNFVQKYHDACSKHPSALIHACR